MIHKKYKYNFRCNATADDDDDDSALRSVCRLASKLGAREVLFHGLLIFISLALPSMLMRYFKFRHKLLHCFLTLINRLPASSRLSVFMLCSLTTCFLCGLPSNFFHSNFFPQRKNLFNLVLPSFLFCLIFSFVPFSENITSSYSFINFLYTPWHWNVDGDREMSDAWTGFSFRETKTR